MLHSPYQWRFGYIERLRRSFITSTHRSILKLCGRCEVSERATHRSSPHGPCEPSARVTGRARTYATDLPKWDSTLPEAASERDHRSPHIRIVSPAVLGSLLHIVTRIRPVRHAYDEPVLLVPRAALVAARPPTGYDRSPGAWTMFPRFRSRTFSHTGRTHRAPEPTHRTRQRLSRHSPSPLRTTHRLAERRPSVSPPS
jgi:hypothetical protein